MNELKEELDRFMGSFRSNPPTEKLNEFLEVLSSEGKLFDYSEQDWVEAGRSYGMSDDEIASWVETAASWLDDTSEGGKYELEPSFWAEEGPQTKANPSVRHGKGTEIEDCSCEETCDCDPCPCDECTSCGFDLCCCVCSEEDDDEEEDEDDEDQDEGEEE